MDVDVLDIRMISIRLFWNGLWILLGQVLAGCGQSVDVSFTQRDRAYFIKPLTLKSSIFNPLLQEEQFAITHPSPFNMIKAKYGQFEAEGLVNQNSFITSHKNKSINLESLKNIEISAHIVSRSLTRERPVLQVLCHSSQIIHVPQNNAKVNKDDKAQAKPVISEQRWCLQVHAQFNLQRAASVCILNGHKNMCTADIIIPDQWWNDAYRSADVYYSYYPIEKNVECSSSSNIIKYETDGTTESLQKFYVGAVHLDKDALRYKELKEDQHILLYVPREPVLPGTKFRGAVKLQAESDVQKFTVRIRVRRGIKVIGVEAKDPDRWHLDVDLNTKRRGAVVVATVHNDKVYTKASRIQDIYDWVFEVEEETLRDGDIDGRIFWQIQYMPSHLAVGPIKQLRASTRIPVNPTEAYHIVPVLKIWEVLNLAILTGRRQTWSIQVYAVRTSGHTDDITKLCSCHSMDEEVIKVNLDCSHVYVDGTETNGARNATIILKHADKIQEVQLTVWIPEVPVNVEISDIKLSQIKLWKAPDAHTRKTRGTDFGSMDTPASLPDRDTKANDDDGSNCHLRFQQADIKVYTRFVLSEMGKSTYWLNRKAQLDITENVANRLRVSDPRIARLDGRIIEGQSKGRTEVQVMSRTGRVIGAKEVRVSTDKVSIKRLEATLVAGLDVEVQGPGDLQGTYIARVKLLEALKHVGQEGFLDIAVHFTDETIIPLHQINPNDYFLEMDTINNHVVAFGPLMTADRPRVKAMGPGKGELLKLSMELGDECRRKISDPLAVSYVYVNVELKDVDKELQNDDFFKKDNRAGGRWDIKPSQTKKGMFDLNLAHAEKKPSVQDDLRNDPEQNAPDLSNMDLDLGELSKSPESSAMQEARRQRIDHIGGVTPLEIGMYTLLGLVCMAVFVIVSYCIVFIVRYRRKRLPKEHGESIAQAKDWVWIGRATLERNRVNTQCSQTLMPPADFNGNQTVRRASNRNSADSSNRNSGVSEYKGSECNIRITSNPIPNGANLEETASLTRSEVQWDYEAMGLTYEQLMEYFDNLKETSA